MDVNIKNTYTNKFGALPLLAQTIRILLVEHDTTSLVSLSSLFEQQNYKVTTVESATMALSLFEEQNSIFDIVIACIPMPEMSISEFAQKLHGHRTTVPIMLIAKDLPMNSMLEALNNGVCYVLPKPPSQSDIAALWQHIPRVTGQMPASLDMTSIKLEELGTPGSESGRGGSARNQGGMDLKMKAIVTEEGHAKRKKVQTANTSGSSTDFEGEDGHHSKKRNITWNFHLHKKFLNAINILDEHDVRPENILTLMNEPGLTYHQVAFHLQTYEEQKSLLWKVQRTASPVIPAVLPSAQVISFNQGNTSVAASSNYTGAPNFLPHGFDGVKQAQDAFNYPGNSSASGYFSNSWEAVYQEPGGSSLGYPGNINQYGAQVPEGGIGYFSNSWNALNQGLGVASTGYLSNGWQVPNIESAGASGEVMPINGYMSNGLQDPAQGAAGAGKHLRNNCEAPKQEPEGEFGTPLFGFGNAGNTGAMNNENHGEGTSGSGQHFGEIPSNEDLNQIMQEFEGSAVSFWDMVKF